MNDEEKIKNEMGAAIRNKGGKNVMRHFFAFWALLASHSSEVRRVDIIIMIIYDFSSSLFVIVIKSTYP